LNKKSLNIEKLYVFVDFDGTITKKDVGDEIFRVFGELEPLHSKLRSGELKIEDYWKEIFKTLKPGVGKKEIQEFAEEIEVDPYFKKFAEYCLDKGIPLTIVSDGFDVYINTILKRLGLENLPVYCNRALFNGGKPEPFYPYASESCDCLCASCKRNSVISNVPEEAAIAFVGDGYSDYCAAEHSDIIFAKKDLAAYCNENKLPHYPFTSFFDVYRTLKDILPKKGIKKRRQAELLRYKAFEIE